MARAKKSQSKESHIFPMNIPMNMGKADTKMVIASWEAFFYSIQVQLKSMDESGLVTHHKWNWKLGNAQSKPFREVAYVLEGDTPKKFSELNVRVSEDRIKKTRIVLKTDEPMKKEFTVSLMNPLFPYEKPRSMVMEYDWEELERTYFYLFHSYCTKFVLELELPIGFKAKPHILWMKHGNPKFKPMLHAPIRKQKDKRMKWTWSVSDVQPFSKIGLRW